jgi:hypothetical protein
MSESNLCNLFWAREASFGAPLPTRQSVSGEFTGVPVSGQTITLDGKVYTFRGAVAQLDADGEVLIGATAAECAANLIAAINLDPTKSGTKYSANTTAPNRFYAESGGGGIVVVKAYYPGAVLGLAFASRILTSTNVQVTANDTVTIDGKVYTFKAVPAVEGEVDIGADADGSLLNLSRAINHTGAPGVDYVCADQHPTVVADALLVGHTLGVSARIAGTGGNAIVVSEVAATLSWASGNLTGGTDDLITSTDTATNFAWANTSMSGGVGVALRMTELRFTGEGITPGKETVKSAEIVQDRTVRELVEVGRTSRGPVNVEMHAAGLDEFLLSALMALEWKSGTETDDYDFDLSGQTIDCLTSTWSARIPGIEDARYIYINAPGQLVTIAKIVSVAGSVITVAPGTILADGIGVTTTISFRYARNGSTLRTYALIKEFLSHSPNTSIACVGMFLDKFDLSLTPKQIATAVLTFGGAQQFVTPGSYGAPNPVAPTNTPVMNTTSNLGAIGYNGSEIGAPVMELTLTVANNLADRNVLSEMTTIAPRIGDFNVTGKLTAYFEDRALLEDFLAHQNRSLEFNLSDVLGNFINLYCPTLSFSAAEPLIPGRNEDILMPLTFEGVNPNRSFVMQIDAILV